MGEIDWFKDIKPDEEFNRMSSRGSQSGGAIIMGHVTYEMMKSFWPTGMAMKSDPDMAKVMNNSRKIVFSKKMKSAEEGPNWKNIDPMHDIYKDEILKMKKQEKMELQFWEAVQSFSSFQIWD